MRAFESGLESWVLSYLVNSLWQAPLVFAAGWLAARAARAAGARAEHRVWVTVLAAQSLLPALSALPGEWMRRLWDWATTARATGDAHVSVVMGAGTRAGGMHWPAGLLATIAIGYGAVTAYFAARFIWRCMRIAALRRGVVEIELNGDAARSWGLCAERFGVADATIASSAQVFGPMTMGLKRKLIVLPEEMAAGLEQTELDTVIAHEFAHIRRNDFLKNLVYELLSLPVSYHPLFWLTRERIMESREMVCDEMAAEISGPKEYACSLLRLARLLVEGMPIRIPHAIGIFDANTLERRLMRLTGKQSYVRGAGRMAIAAACAALGVGTCASALALRLHVDAAAMAADSTKANKPEPRTVPPDEMQGNRVSGPVPVYPKEAKEERIQGTVALTAVIGEDGSVEKLTVVSGPKELQQSALDAVRQWVYKPYLVNGDPVEVKTTIKVIYTLAE
jgi:TonB family protein